MNDCRLSTDLIAQKLRGGPSMALHITKRGERKGGSHKYSYSSSPLRSFKPKKRSE